MHYSLLRFEQRGVCQAAVLVIVIKIWTGLASSFDCHDHSFVWSQAQVQYCSPYACTITDEGSQAWPVQKKSWCCKHQHVACEEDSYDCTAGWATYQESWDPEKRTWCCIHQHMGCTDGESVVKIPTSSHDVPNQHMIGLHTPPHARSGLIVDVSRPPSTTPPPQTTLLQKTTVAQEKAAIPQQQTTQPFYNCYSVPSGWTYTQRNWCCSKLHRGCETTTNLDRFNCEIGESMWPDAQRAWCCRELSRGCAQTTMLTSSATLNVAPPSAVAQLVPSTSVAAAAAAAAEGNSNGGDGCQDVHDWDNYPAARRGFCCKEHHVGCIEFSCIGVSYSGWSSQKQQYCCAHQGVGCTTTTMLIHVQRVNHCQEDLKSWETSWSRAKKKACCKESGFGCEEYDCTSDLGDWQSHWPPAKQGWCCLNKHLGCLTAETGKGSQGSPAGPPTHLSTTTKLFNCQHDVQDPESSSWSQAKRDWCCLNYHLGCDPYNCTEGLQNSKLWAPAKVIWCCHEKQIGCPGQAGVTTTTINNFDCAAGLSKWEQSWPIDKKKWCCQTYQIACGRYNCHEGLERWQKIWTQGKKDWCCANAKLGCKTSRPTLTHAASTSTTTLETSSRQSDPKADRQSSSTSGIAKSTSALLLETSSPTSTSKPSVSSTSLETSSSTSTSTPSVSSTSLQSALQTASQPHKEHSAVSEVLAASESSGGGDDTAARNSYNCIVGIAKWETGWSREKKKWCCVRMQVACAPYDCSQDLGKWNSTWKKEKKLWCCKNAGRGCTEHDSRQRASSANQESSLTSHGTAESSQTHYDCMTDVQDWSHAKQAWCCENTGQGCVLVTTTSPKSSTTIRKASFDCNSWLGDWENEWTKAHKEWCCKHEGFACTATVTSHADSSTTTQSIVTKEPTPTLEATTTTTKTVEVRTSSASARRESNLTVIQAMFSWPQELTSAQGVSTFSVHPLAGCAALFLLLAGLAGVATGWQRLRASCHGHRPPGDNGRDVARHLLLEATAEEANEA